jgi:hypothetical protein
MAVRYQQSKYRSKRCLCNQGHMHDSKGEAGYCNDLELQVKAGVHHSYEVQVRFDLHGRNGKKVCAHYVDFLVYDFDGGKEVHEYKGVATDLWKLKKALFEYEYTDIPYNVIYHKKSGWRNYK